MAVLIKLHRRWVLPMLFGYCVNRAREPIFMAISAYAERGREIARRSMDLDDALDTGNDPVNPGAGCDV